MTTILPEGGISLKSACVFGYFYSNNMYVLCDVSTKDNNIYKFLQATSTSRNKVIWNTKLTNMITFEISGTITNPSFTQIKPLSPSGVGLTVDNNGIATKGIANTTLSISQNLYANWGSDTAALSGVSYNFKYNDIPMSFLVDWNTSPQSIIPIIIPCVFYCNCNSKKCSESTDPQNSVLMTYCSIINSAGIGVCSNIQATGWTTLEDANTAKVYSYCPIDQSCSSTCKGPCTENGGTCQYDSSVTGWSCKTTVTLPNKSFVSSSWFIILIIIILVISVIIVLFILNRIKSNFSKSDDI